LATDAFLITRLKKHSESCKQSNFKFNFIKLIYNFSISDDEFLYISQLETCEKWKKISIQKLNNWV
jgi:hypothetical protein